MIRTIHKVTRNLRQRVLLTLGRGRVRAIDDNGGMQKLQCSFLKNEPTNGLERMQEYGFTSWPLPEAEVMAGFIAGNRDHGIIIAVDDRRYRFKVDAQGDVCIYTDLDKGHDTGHRVYLKRNRDIEVRCNTYDKKADTDETKDIGANVSKIVGGTETKTVTGNVQSTLQANETKNVTGSKTKTVGVNDLETVSGNQTSQVNGIFSKTVNGNASFEGKGTVTIKITGSGLAKVEAGGSLQADVTGNLDANVTGMAKINSTNVELGNAAGKKLVVLNGDSTDVQGSGSHSHTIISSATEVKAV
jgi:phage gp45-like